MQNQTEKVITPDLDILRILIDMREHVLQKERVALNNRLDAIERGADIADENTVAILNYFYERFNDLEAAADSNIKELISEMPIVQAMVTVRGIGPMLSARVVSMIDIRLVGHVSALWKWAGYAVVDGKADGRVKGEKIKYNPRLKKTVYLVGDSFIKSRSPYRDIYDVAKEEYAKNADLTPMHIHRRASRKMVKLWLSHLWQVWRELEGLSTSPAYVHQHLNHTTIIQPGAMGWEW